MLKDRLLWLSLSERLEDEVRQCQYEGRQIDSLLDEIERVSLMEDGRRKEEKSAELLEKMEKAPIREDYPYQEPESYVEIQKTLPDGSEKTYEVKEKLEEKVRGAWYGRAAGCLLGIPVEGWKREKIHGFLKESGQFPLKEYMRSDVEEEVREKYQITDEDLSRPYDRTMICWKNNIHSFPVDDDTNYTVLALRLLEEFGDSFHCENVMENWLLAMPALHACTAERVAIQNTLNMCLPPESGSFRNPYREWIGAQIRGDFYGYINPGDPKKAAEMAYRDAAVSHTKNGIYGEMYIAAMISLAYVSDNGMKICEEAAEQIPPASRLAEAIRQVMEIRKKNGTFEDVIDLVHKRYREEIFFDWCYVIPNAMIVTACVLWFTEDYSEGICHAVSAGFDTDCNGATVGSVLGIINGMSGIEEKWVAGLEPVLRTSIHRYREMPLDEAVTRTVKMIESRQA